MNEDIQSGQILGHEGFKQSVLLGGQCSKAELTADVIQKATEYCKSIN